MNQAIRIIISGGPGSGCTSLAHKLSSILAIDHYDSDDFFHKPTNPPFQQQYSIEERRALVEKATLLADRWVLSGSISSWGTLVPPLNLGVFLDVPKVERMRRLLLREQLRFGKRIDPGGDMYDQHSDFVLWAKDYEVRFGAGRNREYDRKYLIENSDEFIEISEILDLEASVCAVMRVLHLM